MLGKRTRQSPEASDCRSLDYAASNFDERQVGKDQEVCSPIAAQASSARSQLASPAQTARTPTSQTGPTTQGGAPDDFASKSSAVAARMASFFESSGLDCLFEDGEDDGVAGSGKEGCNACRQRSTDTDNNPVERAETTGNERVQKRETANGMSASSGIVPPDAQRNRPLDVPNDAPALPNVTHDDQVGCIAVALCWYVTSKAKVQPGPSSKEFLDEIFSHWLKLKAYVEVGNLPRNELLLDKVKNEVRNWFSVRDVQLGGWQLVTIIKALHLKSMIIANSMGTGKTRCAVLILALTRFICKLRGEHWKGCMIARPLAAKASWEKAFQEFGFTEGTGYFTCTSGIQSQHVRKDFLATIVTPGLLSVHYGHCKSNDDIRQSSPLFGAFPEIVQDWRNKDRKLIDLTPGPTQRYVQDVHEGNLSPPPIIGNLLILDEVPDMGFANPQTSRTMMAFLLALRFSNRLSMTGTPFQNNYESCRALATITFVKCTGNQGMCAQRDMWANKSTYGQVTRRDEMLAVLRRNMTAFTQEVVKEYLPNLKQFKAHVIKQQHEYVFDRQLAKNLVEVGKEILAKENSKSLHMEFISRLLRMRQPSPACMPDRWMTEQVLLENTHRYCGTCCDPKLEKETDTVCPEDEDSDGESPYNLRESDRQRCKRETDMKYPARDTSGEEGSEDSEMEDSEEELEYSSEERDEWFHRYKFKKYKAWTRTRVGPDGYIGHCLRHAVCEKCTNAEISKREKFKRASEQRREVPCFQGLAEDFRNGLRDLGDGQRPTCRHCLELTNDGYRPPVNPYREVRSSRISAAVHLAQREKRRGRKFALFCSWTSGLNLLCSELRARGITYTRIQGGMTTEARDISACDGLRSADGVCVSLRAGGVGLDLTLAQTVIILEPHWNPSATLQAIGRVHRMGQTKSVEVYGILAHDMSNVINRLCDQKALHGGHFMTGKDNVVMGAGGVRRKRRKMDRQAIKMLISGLNTEMNAAAEEKAQNATPGVRIIPVDLGVQLVDHENEGEAADVVILEEDEEEEVNEGETSWIEFDDLELHEQRLCGQTLADLRRQQEQLDLRLGNQGSDANEIEGQPEN